MDALICLLLLHRAAFDEENAPLYFEVTWNTTHLSAHEPLHHVMHRKNEVAD